MERLTALRIPAFMLAVAAIGFACLPVMAGTGPVVIVPPQYGEVPVVSALAPSDIALPRPKPWASPALPMAPGVSLGKLPEVKVSALQPLAMPDVRAVALPRPRPQAGGAAQPPVQVASTASSASTPLPAPRPQVSATLGNVAIGDAEQAPSSWPQAMIAQAQRACQTSLAGIDAEWEPEPAFGGPGSCGAAAPVRVHSIAGVRITPPARLNCQMVAALHGWLTGKVQPAAQRAMASRVVEIKNASSYACRRRNNASTGKMSEHARANALDIESFTFANAQLVSVENDWSQMLQTLKLGSSGEFLRSIDKSACQHFNTVMSPKSNHFHEDHFHVDLLPLKPGRWKYCR